MTDKKTERWMKREFLTGIFRWELLLTPIGSMWRCWEFNDGDIEYLDIYIFGIRIVKWRL